MYTEEIPDIFINNIAFTSVFRRLGVLSIKFEDELYNRVHDQAVSPREVVTEALLKYFRYKNQEVP